MKLIQIKGNRAHGEQNTRARREHTKLSGDHTSSRQTSYIHHHAIIGDSPCSTYIQSKIKGGNNGVRCALLEKVPGI